VLAQFEAHLLGEVDGVSAGRCRRAATSSTWSRRLARRRTIALAKEAGITLTPAGAAYPYGVDPEDSHIRIAPSFPSLPEITQAAEGIALSLKLAIA
jgi:DNA-binding transcriptional MocR family regulator